MGNLEATVGFVPDRDPKICCAVHDSMCYMEATWKYMKIASNSWAWIRLINVWTTCGFDKSWDSERKMSHSSTYSSHSTWSHNFWRLAFETGLAIRSSMQIQDGQSAPILSWFRGAWSPAFASRWVALLRFPCMHVKRMRAEACLAHMQATARSIATLPLGVVGITNLPSFRSDGVNSALALAFGPFSSCLSVRKLSWSEIIDEIYERSPRILSSSLEAEEFGTLMKDAQGGEVPAGEFDAEPLPDWGSLAFSVYFNFSPHTLLPVWIVCHRIEHTSFHLFYHFAPLGPKCPFQGAFTDTRPIVEKAVLLYMGKVK